MLRLILASLFAFVWCWSALTAQPPRGLGKPTCEAFLAGPAAAGLNALPTSDARLFIDQKVYVFKDQRSSGWIVYDKPNGRILFKADSLVLESAEFVVQRGRKQRAKRSGVRKQHAGVMGVLKEVNPDAFSRRGWTEIKYRPDDMETFETMRQEEEIQGANRVFFESSDRVFGVGLVYN